MKNQTKKEVLQKQSCFFLFFYSLFLFAFYSFNSLPGVFIFFILSSPFLSGHIGVEIACVQGVGVHSTAIIAPHRPCVSLSLSRSLKRRFATFSTHFIRVVFDSGRCRAKRWSIFPFQTLPFFRANTWNAAYLGAFLDSDAH